MHEFSWWSLGRNAVDQANDVERKAVEGDWLILGHADRSKFQSRLVVTDAIVIGRVDGLSSTSHPVTIQMRFLGFLANDNGASRLFVDVLHLSEWSGLWERYQDRLVNDKLSEGAQGLDIPVVVSHRS